MSRPIRGLEDFKKDLARFEKKVAGKLLRDALRDGAKAMAAPVKAEAPVDTGLVRKSVKVRAGRRSRKYVSARVTVTGGHPDQVIGFVALGTKDQEGDDFIRRAYDAHADPIRAGILSKLKSSIEREGK